MSISPYKLTLIPTVPKEWYYRVIITAHFNLG